MSILFVYNANSGRLNTWLDIGHKLLSPATYSCNLCALTHGLLSEREEWRRYREAAGEELVFLHRDEFEQRYGKGHDFGYPVVLKQRGDERCEVLLAADEINGFAELSELIERLRDLQRTGE